MKKLKTVVTGADVKAQLQVALLNQWDKESKTRKQANEHANRDLLAALSTCMILTAEEMDTWSNGQGWLVMPLALLSGKEADDVNTPEGGDPEGYH